jgi:flagellar hook-length control protein FliK
MAELTIIPRGHAQTSSTAQAGSKNKNRDDMEKASAPFAEMLAMFFPLQMPGLQDNHADAPADSETQKCLSDEHAVAELSANAVGSSRFIIEAVNNEAVHAIGINEVQGNAEAGVQTVQQQANVTAIIANAENSEDIAGAANATDVSGVRNSADAENTAITAAVRRTAIAEMQNAAVNSKIHNFAAKEATHETTVLISAEQGAEGKVNIPTEYQPQPVSELHSDQMHPSYIQTELEAKLKPADLLHKVLPDNQTGQPAFTRSLTEGKSTAKALSGDLLVSAGRPAVRAGQLAKQVGSDTETVKSNKASYEQQPGEPAFTLSGMQQAQENEQFHIEAEQMVQKGKSIGHSIIEQMIDKLTLSDKDNKKELTVQLKPDTLGTVIIKLLEDKGITAARIITSNPEARDLINSQIPALKQQLADQGISFQDLDVVHDGSSFLQKQADSGSNPNHRSNPDDTWLPTARTSRESSTEQGGSLELQRMLHAGRINYFV